MVTSKFKNPWDRNSIYEFQFYNCPYCVFINHSKQEFVIHAYESHPDIISYLKNIKDNSLSDINCPWNKNDSNLDNVRKINKEYHFLGKLILSLK